MCDKHTHAKLEQWVTPINSQHLSSKLVTLFPGESIHEHTTGPGREEVLVILYGAVTVRQGKTERRYVSGETCFIPAETLHAVRNDDNDPAQYCYVVTKARPAQTPCLLFHAHPNWRN